MAFVPAFYTTQAIVATAFTLVDSSTGSDVAITQRRIYLYLADGTTLVPTGTTTAYIDFPLSDGGSILLNVLNVDYAISVTVQWLNVSNAVLYTLTQNYCFTANDEAFYFSLTTMQTSQPSIINDTNFFNNKSLLRLHIDSATQAVSKGNDVYKSQFCLNKAQNLINNQQDYF
jgi:hypothetical protein